MCPRGERGVRARVSCVDTGALGQNRTEANVKELLEKLDEDDEFVTAKQVPLETRAGSSSPSCPRVCAVQFAELQGTKFQDSVTSKAVTEVRLR